ncbi:heme-binding domain-containing protein [uncultured Sunxiuqinia sp.]|uniref:heme-binding domain-containing protein n=1 Tax=uncultured Sunxiuqinia sp. TaxID=1573825 RepID=UPI002AA8439A|nr:heme-binding domain-containing protein [uncultured Sunxiuqinia sp.]
MKKLNLSLSLLLAALSFYLTSSASGKEEPNEKAIQMSKEVKAVINNSCFGCHNTDSRNDDAKEDLDFKTWHELSTVKQLGALKDIKEVLIKNEMPPQKFLEHKPDKALSDDQKELLVVWVKEQSKSLLNK